MEDQAVTIPEIRALVAERQRFDDWLNALEDRRAETPARVFERVHADYLARRDAIIDNLHTHVGALEALERDLDNRLQLLEAQLAEREDARAEGMLRTAVGEFDSERWETTRVEVEEAIAQLGTDREALQAETEDVRALLVSARHRPGVTPEAADTEPLVVAGVPDLESELISSNVAQAIAHADPAVVAHGVNLDADGETTRASDGDTGTPYSTDPYQREARRHAETESDIESAFAVHDDPFETLGDTREVSVPRDGGTPAGAIAAVNADSDDADRELNDAVDAIDAMDGASAPSALDELDVFGEPATTSRGTPADAAQARSGHDSYATRPQATPPQNRSGAAETGTGSASTGSASTGGMPTRDDLAFLRSITDSGNAPASGSTRANGSTEQTKTLRCTECGTMNFPTEWYCERCGGELATF